MKEGFNTRNKKGGIGVGDARTFENLVSKIRNKGIHRYVTLITDLCLHI